MKFYSFFTLIILSFLLPIYGQESESNLAIADELYRQTLDSLCNGIAEPELQIVIKQSNDSLFLNSGWIQYWVTQTGIKDSVTRIFVLERFNITVNYLESGSSFFGISRKLKRDIKLSLRGYIKEKESGKIFNAFKLQKIHSSNVDRKQLAALEAGPFEFTRGQYETKSKWTKYLEPAIITAGVAAIVYLFFSIRS